MAGSRLWWIWATCAVEHKDRRQLVAGRRSANCASLVEGLRDGRTLIRPIGGTRSASASMAPSGGGGTSRSTVRAVVRTAKVVLVPLSTTTRTPMAAVGGFLLGSRLRAGGPDCAASLGPRHDVKPRLLQPGGHVRTSLSGSACTLFPKRSLSTASRRHRPRCHLAPHLGFVRHIPTSLGRRV